jgi:putative ABC transport system ATP-binding protein
MAAVELEDVRKVYESGDAEIVALDHATLTVDDDEIVALVGPSGSGKTTLLSIAGGLLGASEGRVVVGGRDISDLSARERTTFRRDAVGFVFQTVNLVPFLTARENLTVVSELTGQRGRDVRERADQLLDDLDLGKRGDNLATKLSGGEKQRVAVARALMRDPALVLIDEPTSSLDTTLGQQVMELIRREIKGRGVAAIVVTHDPRMTRYADRTVEIVDGTLEA